MTKEQEAILNQYQGIADPRLEHYLYNAEKSVIGKIPVWPLRIREWAVTPMGEVCIRDSLKISRSSFLWLETQVNARKIIHIEDVQNSAPQITRHMDASHVIQPDQFRAFSFITWGFLHHKNSRSEIDDWDNFIAEVKSSGGSNRLVELIHDPEERRPYRTRVNGNHPPTGDDGKPPKTESNNRHWHGDYKNPTFNIEEQAELSLTNSYHLKEFIDKKREMKTFEIYFEDDLDISDTKMRALCFINGVRKKLLRYQMRVKVEEARQQGRQSLYKPEKVQVIFDPNSISLDNLLETAEFTQKLMEEREISFLTALKLMEQLNKKLGN